MFRSLPYANLRALQECQHLALRPRWIQPLLLPAGAYSFGFEIAETGPCGSFSAFIPRRHGLWLRFPALNPSLSPAPNPCKVLFRELGPRPHLAPRPWRQRRPPGSQRGRVLALVLGFGSPPSPETPALQPLCPRGPSGGSFRTPLVTRRAGLENRLEV